MIHLPATGYRRERWRNGGGWTRQIAAGSLATPIFDANASPPEWDWRLSIAEIETDGPFSVFPGVDRSLLLLAGAGMELVCEGGLVAPLSVPGDRFDFAGEARVAARLLDGPTVDFNLMWRRDVLFASLRICPTDTVNRVLERPAWVLALYLLDGAVRAGQVDIAAGDTLLLPRATLNAVGNIQEVQPGRFLMIQIDTTTEATSTA